MFGQQDDANNGDNTATTQPSTGVVDGMPPTASPADAPDPAPTPQEPTNDAGAYPPPMGDQPATDLPAPVDPAASSLPAAPMDGQGTDELLDIKQQALQQLSPLVGHLDQSPEDKFRTTMMMTQASDNSSLIKDAYEAAQSIPDEKVKAQALLDIVNEINYFTQHQDQ